MSKVAIILGMHRSGTSLIAQYINKLGINLGDEILGKYPSNKDGHFEDIDFLNFHRELLAKNNQGDFLIDSDLTFVFDSSESEKAELLYKNKMSRREQWGWKDPRTCLFIENWNKIIKDSVYLIIFRNPDLVINSIIKREYDHIKTIGKTSLLRKVLSLRHLLLFRIKRKKFVDKIAKTWLIYNNKILSVIDERPCFIVNVDNIHKVDKSIFSFFKRNGFNVNYIPLKTIFKNELLTKNEYKFPKIMNNKLRQQCHDVFKKLNEISELNNSINE